MAGRPREAQAEELVTSRHAAEPDVTVVVIAYNDAARLPRAVDSVLAQTHPRVEVVVVDDCSTDGTGEVAERLAAAPPARVRALRLPENSGGCSRPRNAGLELARGTHVMFLDSDDELAPDACRVLWEAAVAEDADFAAGRTVRVHLAEPPRESAWRPALYDRRRVVKGVRELPDLVDDTLSTNKCWRIGFLREHGLAFPEGIHYEDVVFTAEAYLVAGTFVLVPDRVYTWYVDDSPDGVSITNSREDLANLRDRLEAQRRVDDLFRSHGASELQLAKDAKFLKYDLKLYVSDFPRRDREWRRAVLASLRDYLSGFHPEAAARAGLLPRIEVLFLTRGDALALLWAVWLRPAVARARRSVRRTG
jgi:CDP-glycerol glycerophosphotransferase